MKSLRSFFAIIMMGVMVISTVSLGGCGKSEEKLKEIIETTLEEKYDEEFVCLDVWVNGGDSYYGVCYPKNNQELLFECLFYTNGDLISDGYASRVISERFSKKLHDLIGDSFNECFVYCYNNGDMFDDMTVQKIKDDEFTLDYYFKKRLETTNDNKITLNYTICFNTSAANKLTYEDEYDLILKSLKQIKQNSDVYGAELSFRMNLCFVPENIYNKCVDYFKENAQIKSSFQDMIEGYPERKYKRLIKFDIGIDIYKLTKDEYVKLRKEVN